MGTYLVYELDVCMMQCKATSAEDALRQARVKFGYTENAPLFAELVG